MKKNKIDLINDINSHINKKNSNNVPAYQVYGFKSNDSFLEFCFYKGIIVKNVINDNTNKKILSEINKSKYQRTLLKQNKDDIIDNILIKMNESFSYIGLFDYEYLKKDLISIVFFLKKYKKIFRSYEKNMFSIKNNNFFFFSSLLHIVYHKDKWIRDIEDWKCKERTPYKIIFSLFDHLFKKYDQPTFFYSVLFEKIYSEKDFKKSEFLITILQGASVLKTYNDYIPHIPYFKKLNKKEVNSVLFKNKPFDNFQEIIRKTELFRYTDDSYFVDQILKSDFAYGNNKIQNSLLFDYLNFLKNKTNDMFNKEIFLPLYDYIVHKHNRYLNENKKFTFKGRDINILVNEMFSWHRNLNKNKGKNYFSWLKTYPDFRYDYKTNNEFLEKFVTIKQITDSNELHNEGKILNHCVYSYLNKCRNKQCFIFSCEITEFFKTKKILTIEVRPGGDIIQIRGKLNRTQTKEETFFIKKWAEELGFYLA